MVRFVIAALFTIIFNAALAGDLEDGVAAMDRKDYKTALAKFRSAAQQGNARAQSNLGVLYFEGQGVLQDYTRAHMWFNIAAIAGDKDSVTNRDLAASKMTAQQIEQAQRMARECMSSNYAKCD
jgi:TPR repeat protein